MIHGSIGLIESQSISIKLLSISACEKLFIYLFFLMCQSNLFHLTYFISALFAYLIKLCFISFDLFQILFHQEVYFTVLSLSFKLPI